MNKANEALFILTSTFGLILLEYAIIPYVLVRGTLLIFAPTIVVNELFLIVQATWARFVIEMVVRTISNVWHSQKKAR